MTGAVHPLATFFLDAAAGRFPPVDGKVTFLPAPAPGRHAVVSFTGHAVIATSLPAAAFDDLAPDGYGTASHPAVLLRLAGAGGSVGVLDTTLVTEGLGGGTLPERHDRDRHHRVLHARRLREEVRVHGDHRGLVTIARGLAGRTELSVELEPDVQGRGQGASLILDGLALVAAGEPVFAAVAPGNARSLRAFLGLGFRPLGSEVIVLGT